VLFWMLYISLALAELLFPLRLLLRFNSSLVYLFQFRLSTSLFHAVAIIYIHVLNYNCHNRYGENTYTPVTGKTTSDELDHNPLV